MVRQARLLVPTGSGRAIYHCISRIVNRDFVMGPTEKAKFFEYLRFYEKFCKVRVLTYCLMSNHFHLLVEVPERPAGDGVPDAAWLVDHVAKCYGVERAGALAAELSMLEESGAVEARDRLLESWFGRMWDLGAFMKVLKQRFSQWYNSEHDRKGTLWEERYRSTIVEPSRGALEVVAAYVDLNPVRARLVSDPKDYRWCGYAEALATGYRAGSPALRGLREVVDSAEGSQRRPEGVGGKDLVKTTLESYRVLLFGTGGERGMNPDGTPARAGFSPEVIEKVLAEGGSLSRPQLLRCRVRYFTEGWAIGSRSFIEGLFQTYRSRFGSQRQIEPRQFRGLDRLGVEGVHTLRDLSAPVEIPP